MKYGMNREKHVVSSDFLACNRREIILEPGSYGGSYGVVTVIEDSSGAHIWRGPIRPISAKKLCQRLLTRVEQYEMGE